MKHCVGLIILFWHPCWVSDYDFFFFLLCRGFRGRWEWSYIGLFISIFWKETCASWNANGRLFGTCKQGAHCHYCCCCSCLVAKPYLTLCDPMDCSPPDSSVHGISQARILERVAIFFSRGSSWHGIEPASPALVFFLFVCLFVF